MSYVDSFGASRLLNILIMGWQLVPGAHTRPLVTSSEPVSCLNSAPPNQRKGKQRIAIFTRSGTKCNLLSLFTPKKLILK